MVAKIATLKATVEEITEENRVIRIVLDQKQHKWTKTETKSRKVKEPKANNATNPITSPNRFQVLHVDDKLQSVTLKCGTLSPKACYSK